VHSIRRTGSTAINLAYVACGRLDAFWVRRIACWDVAAGLLIAREAGATIGSFSGDAGAQVSLAAPAFIAACSPAMFESLHRMLGGAASGC
jgi:myo-inositol-1(or 4)-monophosphatase